MAMRSGVSCWRCAVFLTPPRDALRGKVRSLSGEALAVRGAPLREGCGYGSARSRVLCLFYSGLALGWLSEPWETLRERRGQKPSLASSRWLHVFHVVPIIRYIAGPTGLAKC